jgi:hypothetical protein
MEDLALRVAQKLAIDAERVRVWTDDSGQLRVDLQMDLHREGPASVRDSLQGLTQVVGELLDDPDNVTVGVGPLARMKI